MRERIFLALVGLGCVVIAAALLWRSMLTPEILIVRTRVPGMDRQDAASSVVPSVVPAVAVTSHNLATQVPVPEPDGVTAPVAPTAVAPPSAINPGFGGTLTRGEGVPGRQPGAWPCFRGAARDNLVTEAVPLADAWATNGPTVVWRLDVGEGHAGAAVADGRVFVLDYDETTKCDVLRCLSLDDAREIWRFAYTNDVKRNHGVSRSVPAIADGRVVSIGPSGHVLCCDVATGAPVWSLDLVAQYGAKPPMWYASQCPLIDNGEVVIAPAGASVMLLGVALADGRVNWTVPNPEGWKLSHASIVPLTLRGVRQFVYAPVGGVLGVGADGDLRGKPLWSLGEWSPSVAAPSPVAPTDTTLFMTAGYGKGGGFARIDRADDGTWSATLLTNYPARAGFASEHHTPILWREHLFAIMPKDAGAQRNQFVCADAAGKTIWSSGQTARFGLGPYLIADNKFFLMSDDGTLVMFRASLKAYEELGRSKVLPGPDAWGPMAFAGGYLICRDDRHMVCLNLRQP